MARSTSNTTHKDRCVWFYERASFPQRDATPLELEKFWARPDIMQAAGGDLWECVGPFNIAGRMTSLVIDPRNWKTLYAGSAAGGFWISTDRGATWKPRWQRFTNQNIGAIAVRPGSIIVATGEANLSPDGYPGSGLYQSNDGGSKWESLFHDIGTLTIEDNVASIPRRVGCIALDPFSESRTEVALASVTHDDRMPAGLFLIGAGLRVCKAWGERSYNCHSVLYHPKRKGVMFAAIEPRGSNNGIWRSDDGGTSWRPLRTGLPPGEHFRRTSLAIAPSDPDVIYALAADRHKRVLGVFRSNNGGNRWREIGGGRFVAERFMSYNNTITVHPNDPDFVVWGGANLYRTTDGGKRWKKITSGDPGEPNYVHPDHHAIVVTPEGVIYSANDGGVAMSESGGKTWVNRSNGLVTTQFYDLDVARTASKIFGGGTQDNGTLITGVGKTKPGEFIRALPGDGAWMVFDEADPEHVFGSAQNFMIYRHRRGRPWTRDGWLDVAPDNMPEGERAQRAIAVIAMTPGRRAAKKIWAGSHRLWRTKNDGKTWRVASPDFDGSVISAIEVAPADPRIMYVATTKGGIFRSGDGGKTWSEDVACAEIPRRLITRIETHPLSADMLVVTVASTGAPGLVIRSGEDTVSGKPERKPYSHVFYSRNGGQSWTDLDGGALPNVVYYAAVYETHPPYRLFIAGDVGVLVAIPNGWLSLTGNLPNVVVSDLVYHHDDQLLFAATYGRGIWRLNVKDLKHGTAEMGGGVNEASIVSVGRRRG